MTAVNPFYVPGRTAKTVRRPLCPWEHPEHRDYYVPVDRSAAAFDEFIRELDDPASLLKQGQLVLVTGESGCGKSALLNRCADWATRGLHRKGVAYEIIDLTRVLDGRPQQLPIDDRMRITCEALLVELKLRGTLRPDAQDELAENGGVPEQVYPYFPAALPDNTVLTVLLPNPGELTGEVVRYANLVRGRVLFLVESSMLSQDDVDGVLYQMKDWNPPITLRVGALEPGDVGRFASDRLSRHSRVGNYPRMSQETMDSAETLLRSVAQLQWTLSETYEARRRSGRGYGRHSWVTYDDIRRQVESWLGRRR